jgi:NADH-quinone oxidoreductase subunit E
MKSMSTSMNPMDALDDRVDTIIDSYGADPAVSLAVLHEIQREYNYLPRAALERVSERMDVDLGELYRMATFYRSFTLRPKGEFCIRVCLGTACHVHGGPRILEAFERELGIRAGESTADGSYSLEATACLGACAQAPFVMVNDVPYPQMSADRVPEVLEACQCAIPETAREVA